MRFSPVPLLLAAAFILPSSWARPNGEATGQANPQESFDRRDVEIQQYKTFFDGYAKQLDDQYLHGELQLAKRARLLSKYTVTPLQPDAATLATFQKKNIVQLVDHHFIYDVPFFTVRYEDAAEAAGKMLNWLEVLGNNIDSAQDLLALNNQSLQVAAAASEENRNTIASEVNQLKEMRETYDRFERIGKTVIQTLSKLESWFGNTTVLSPVKLPLDMKEYLRTLVRTRHQNKWWQRWKLTLWFRKRENWAVGILQLTWKSNNPNNARECGLSADFMKHAIDGAKERTFIDALTKGLPDIPEKLLRALQLTHAAYRSQYELDLPENRQKVKETIYMLNSTSQDHSHGINEALARGLGMRKYKEAGKAAFPARRRAKVLNQQQTES